MVYSAEQSQQIIAAAAYEAAPKYGIRDVDGFVLAMLALSGWESGGWNAAAIGDAGASVGLLQLHERGQGTGMSVAERQDPYKNVQKAITYLAPVYAAAEQAGGGWQEGLRNMAGPQGQNPADPEALYQGALSYVRQLGGLAGRAAGAAGQAGVGGFQEAAPTAGQGTAARDVIPWMTQFFVDKTYQLESGATLTKTAAQQASDAFADDPTKWISLWREETGQEAGVTELERRETEAGIAVDWANARSIIAWDEGSTYEQMRQKMLDLLDQGQVKQENMISEFNAWMSAAVEARLRGEKVYGEEKERAVWTTPTEHYPGTEPGGINQQMYERYGLGESYKPSPGVPVSQMPSQEQMYGQWHQNMGISQQAPPTAGGWSGQGQGAPQGAGQGTGLNAAMEFLKRMNLRQGAPQGAAPAY